MNHLQIGQGLAVTLSLDKTTDNHYELAPLIGADRLQGIVFDSPNEDALREALMNDERISSIAKERLQKDWENVLEGLKTRQNYTFTYSTNPQVIQYEAVAPEMTIAQLQAKRKELNQFINQELAIAKMQGMDKDTLKAVNDAVAQRNAFSEQLEKFGAELERIEPRVLDKLGEELSESVKEGIEAAKTAVKQELGRGLGVLSNIKDQVQHANARAVEHVKNCWRELREDISYLKRIDLSIAIKANQKFSCFIGHVSETIAKHFDRRNEFRERMQGAISILRGEDPIYVAYQMEPDLAKELNSNQKAVLSALNGLKQIADRKAAELLNTYDRSKDAALIRMHQYQEELESYGLSKQPWQVQEAVLQGTSANGYDKSAATEYYKQELLADIRKEAAEKNMTPVLVPADKAIQIKRRAEREGIQCEISKININAKSYGQKMSAMMVAGGKEVAERVSQIAERADHEHRRGRNR